MAYGTVKVDNITFDNGGSDQNVTVSGIHRAITSGVSVTGTISGVNIIGTTLVSGATVAGTTVSGTTVQGVSGTFTSLTGVTTTGTTANFASGVFTTRISGATVTGTTAQFTSGTFVSLTGTTITGTTVNATTISSTTGTFTSLTGTTITGGTVQGITVTATTGNYTSLTGVTTTGTTANFVSGVFTTQVSGLTVTGTVANFTSGNFVTLSGTSLTLSSGITAANFVPTGSGVPTNGIYLPAANTVGVATNGSGKLFVKSTGVLSIGSATTYEVLAGAGDPAAQINGTVNLASIEAVKWQGTSFTSRNSALRLAVSDGASIGTHGLVASGRTLGQVSYFGSDGNAFYEAAKVQAEVDGTAASGTIPGRLTFAVTSSGSSSPTERMRIRSDGNIGIGTIGQANIGIYNAKSITGGTSAYGVITDGEIQSDVTSGANGYYTGLKVANASFTLPSLIHYQAIQGTIGASATVTNQYGFAANNNLTGATNNFGFYSNIAAATGRWNFYAGGTAENFFGGKLTVGGIATSSVALSTTVPAKFYVDSDTYTDTVTAASGTVSHGTIAAFDNPSINSTNASVTYTTASTVYIDGAPAGTGNVTITNPYALYVNAGQTSVPLGAVGAPSITFGADKDTGIWSPAGGDTIAVSTGGVERLRSSTTEVVFNEGGADCDFRIEGDTNPNLFVVDAGTDEVRVANINGGSLAGMRNAVINGSFAIAQRGTSFTSTSSANNDDTYNLDRWYVLSDGNDAVDITQNTSVVPTNGKYAIALDVETVNKKFGIAQIIEADNCIGLIGETVTLSFKAKVSATTKLDNVKAAIVAWSGTADTVTSDIISAWNVEGTNPTLIANATYENTPANLNLTTSYATYSITAAVDTASTKNILVFIWSDVTDTTLGDFLYIAGVQLERGPVATPFERRPIGTELALCQRYYEIGRSGFGARNTGDVSIGDAVFTVTKRGTPTITTTGIFGTGAITTSSTNERGFEWYRAPVSLYAAITYTASAEL